MFVFDEHWSRHFLKWTLYQIAFTSSQSPPEPIAAVGLQRAHLIRTIVYERGGFICVGGYL
jgi:hypothetical protein